jgi:hypothetical protein
MEKSLQTIDVPKEAAPANLSLLDRLTSRLCTKDEVAQAIMDEVHSGLSVHCSIPEGYAHCDLATAAQDIDSLGEPELRKLLARPSGMILNPEIQHLKAIEFFSMILEGNPLVCDACDPLRPNVGAYLYGPPGVGKTHIMAAFGRKIAALLQERLSGVMGRIQNYTEMFHRQYEYEMQKFKYKPGTAVYDLTADGGMHKHEDPAKKFEQGIESIRKQIREHPDQPTDMLYLGFEDLCELYLNPSTRKDALEAIERAPVVFVDDLHGKGDPERLMVIQRLIERRYELKRFGTFLTTNIDISHIGGADTNIGKRILSRSHESFAMFDFSQCIDWREKVKQRKITLIEQEIERRLAVKSTQVPAS